MSDSSPSNGYSSINISHNNSSENSTTSNTSLSIGIEPNIEQEYYIYNNNIDTNINNNKKIKLSHKDIINSSSINDNNINVKKTKIESNIKVIEQILLYGNEESKKSLFYYKNRELHFMISSLIEQNSSFVLTALLPILNKYFIEFFNNDISDNNEKLSLELLKQLVQESNEIEGNILLNIINNNYNKISSECKKQFIELTLLLFRNVKNKPRNEFIFMIGCLYLISGHISDILLNKVEIQLIHFVLEQHNEYINNILFQTILDYVSHNDLTLNECIFIQENLINKYDINTNNNYNEIKSIIQKQIVSYNDISISDEYIENNIHDEQEQCCLFNIEDYLLSFIKNTNEQIHNEELTSFLLSKSKKKLYSIELQNIVNTSPLLVSLIFTPFLITNIHILSIHKYSKFLAIEIIKHMPHNQYHSFLLHLQPHFQTISTHTEGSKVIHSFIEHIYSLSFTINSSLPSIIHLLSFISSSITSLMTSTSNNIIPILISYNVPYITDILSQLISSHLISISNNKNGLSKLLNILKSFPNNNYLHYIINNATNEVNLPLLMYDQYGRYLICFILDNYGYYYVNEIMKYLMMNFMVCATHKYCSLIVEQCLIKIEMFCGKMMEEENVLKLAGNEVGYHLVIAVMKKEGKASWEMKRKVKKIVLKNKKVLRDTEIGMKIIKEALK